ncbi:Lsr2 family protein [Streptomyces sp. NPDC059994]|uniref:histone-like nucleoid-structuring protein Lsr2 n=1 Tax=Streptomyces sp. NPDC059994 TaxID=3347029 RepID=UPI0036B75246
MAQKLVTTYIDDLDGTEVTEPGVIRTVQFGIDGAEFEIDLTDANEDQLRKLLTPYVTAGRRVQSEAGRPVQRSSAKGRNALDTQAVRAWARENNFEVSDRGRIPDHIQEAYRQAASGGSSAAPAAPPASTSRTDVIVSEEEAARHYQALPIPSGREHNWTKREGYGCERTIRIAEMTLMERIEALTEKNLNVLGQLVGDIPTGKDGKVKGLGTSGQRLLNMEFIDAYRNLTDFGRYAYQVHKQK